MNRVDPAFGHLPSDPRRPDVGQLLRSLLLVISCGFSGDGDPTMPGDGDEVLLDVDLDGSRYLLVRMAHAESARATLSPREQEVARMVAAGYASKTIASVLNISSWTVGTHLRRIFAKLGVKTRAAMVARLHEVGPASTTVSERRRA